MPKGYKGTYTNGLGYKDIRKPAQAYWSEVINADVTVAPPSLAAAAGELSSAITVTGASVGDRVNVFPPYSTKGVMVFGDVSADDTVTLSFFNPTSAEVALASGTWRVQVIKP